MILQIEMYSFCWIKNELNRPFIIPWILGNDRTKGYHELNAKIEQLSEWFCFALLSTLLSTILFPLFYAGIAYYILDFGEESFHLYPPTEFVTKKLILSQRKTLIITFMLKMAIRLANTNWICGGMVWWSSGNWGHSHINYTIL